MQGQEDVISSYAIDPPLDFRGLESDITSNSASSLKNKAIFFNDVVEGQSDLIRTCDIDGVLISFLQQISVSLVILDSRIVSMSFVGHFDFSTNSFALSLLHSLCLL